MYFTYDRYQFNATTLYGEGPRASTLPHEDPQPNKRSFTLEGLYNTLTLKPDFRPTWLVRTSDMKVVPGSTVKEDYYTLSYSWNCSGDIVKENDKDYRRIDNGKHQIITYKTKPKGWSKKEIKPSKHSVRYVKFEGIVQQVCKDFNIQYIWYDQMCIDQDNPERKRSEIQRMHLIYRNAYCTVALIPEFHVGHQYVGKEETEIGNANVSVIGEAEWSKRVWTLQEAYLSKKILFVGRDVHLWSPVVDSDSMFVSNALRFLYSICAKSLQWNVCTALWHARNRTSSKAHDRVFALANMFPDIMSGIRFNYDQPLLDLMVQFYSLLAKQDLSILCFGAPAEERGREVRLKEDFLLPSWTGIDGVHIPQGAGNNLIPKSFPTKHIIDGAVMYLKSCTCIPVSIRKAGSVRHTEPIANPRNYTPDGLPRRPIQHTFYHGPLQLHAQSPPKSLSFVTLKTSPNSIHHNGYLESYGLRVSHCLPIKQQSDNSWINTLISPKNVAGYLSLTERRCTECFILSDISFDLGSNSFVASPVVKETGDGYKAIGLCLLINLEYMDRELKVTRDIVIK